MLNSHELDDTIVLDYSFEILVAALEEYLNMAPISSTGTVAIFQEFELRKLSVSITRLNIYNPPWPDEDPLKVDFRQELLLEEWWAEKEKYSDDYWIQMMDNPISAVWEIQGRIMNTGGSALMNLTIDAACDGEMSSTTREALQEIAGEMNLELENILDLILFDRNLNAKVDNRFDEEWGKVRDAELKDEYEKSKRDHEKLKKIIFAGLIRDGLLKSMENPLKSTNGSPIEEVAESTIPKESKRGPTIKTQMRAEEFKRLKDMHPEWTQEKVAMEAGAALEESLTANSVKNAYKAMSWIWNRGDRIR